MMRTRFLKSRLPNSLRAGSMQANGPRGSSASSSATALAPGERDVSPCHFFPSHRSIDDRMRKTSRTSLGRVGKGKAKRVPGGWQESSDRIVRHPTEATRRHFLLLLLSSFH
nr:hypothetical protein CFP56_30714 [Quercus suber]